MDGELKEDYNLLEWMRHYNRLQENVLQYQKEINLIRQSYNQIKFKKEETEKENAVLRDRLWWLILRNKNLETLLKTSMNVSETECHESPKNFIGGEELMLNSTLKGCTEYDDHVNSHIFNTYREDGIMQTTKELRKFPKMSCPDQWQRCHEVGLNLIKKILNYYTRVHRLTLSKEEFDVLKRDINDESLNMRCCSIESNKEDIVIEREVLEYIFDGKLLETEPARQMFRRLLTFLSVVDSHLNYDSKMTIILNDLKAENFPLPHY
jgi:hypothetical protein